MNSELIGQTWDKLSGQHQEIVTTFYNRFFEKYPNYRALFPESLDRQMKKMVDTMALIARVSDETEVAHPHLVKVGSKHSGYKINREDLDKFKRVFLEVVGEYCGDEWNEECEKAWITAFDQHVIPYMMHGLKQGQKLH